MSENVDETTKRLAVAVSDETYRKCMALIRDMADQLREPVGTFRHQEATVTSQDLAEELLAVKYLTPELAVFALARTSAALVLALCKQYGADPEKLLSSLDSAYVAAAQRRDETQS